MRAADGFSGLSARKGRPLMERMMERVMPVPHCGCWIWTGGLYNTGYGMAFLPGGRPALAHRAMLIALGIDVPSHLVVMHTCDLRCCVNPDHLVVGTQTENLADMTAKGRRVKSYKIPAEWREKIRRDDTPTWALAMWFGVCEKTIRTIRKDR